MSLNSNLQQVAKDKPCPCANTEGVAGASVTEPHTPAASADSQSSDKGDLPAQPVNTEEYWRARGHKIGTLVRRTDHYIVHISEETFRIDWETTGENEKSENFDRKRDSQVMAMAAILETLPCSDLPVSIQKDFRILIGEALACGFDCAYDTADMLFQEAQKYYSARSQERSRYWLVIASMWAALPAVVLGCALWYVRDVVIPKVGSGLFWMAIAASVGALGALFSVLMRTGSAASDCSSGRAVHNLEGAARVLTGAIAGVFVVMAFRSGLLIPELFSQNGSSYFMVGLAMAAGSGERLASSIMEKFNLTKEV